MSETTAFTKFKANIHSFADIWLFLQITTLATFLPLLLSTLSMPRLLHLLTPKTPVSHDKDLSTAAVEKPIKFTDYILRRNVWIYRPNCLKRSLILYHFLRRTGLDVHIYLGVKRGEQPLEHHQDGDLGGHAWLVYQGMVLAERTDEAIEDFVVTFYYPNAVHGNK